MGRVLRFVTYAVLGPFMPLARLILLFLAFAGFAECVIYRLLMHDPRFPLAIILSMSVGCCVAAALLELLLQRLSPG